LTHPGRLLMLSRRTAEVAVHREGRARHMSHLYGRGGPSSSRPPAPPAGPAPGARPNCAAPLRPGSAVVAAALAVLAAALLLTSVVLVLAGVVRAGSGPADGAWSLAAGVVLTCALAATGLIGAVSLHRGTGRTLLLATAWVETGLVAATAAWSAAMLTGASGARPPMTTGVLVGALAALLLTGAQIRLASARPVVRWLESTALARESAASGTGRRGGLGATLAVVVPVAVLAVVTAVVVVGTGPPAVPGTGPATPLSPAGETRTPVAPPAAGGGDWSAEFDRDAQACFAGSMTACDDLYWESSVGDAYESYGSTCGGRLARGTEGGCVAALGSRLN
jgi:hypothetical protein